MTNEIIGGEIKPEDWTKHKEWMTSLSNNIFICLQKDISTNLILRLAN